MIMYATSPSFGQYETLESMLDAAIQAIPQIERPDGDLSYPDAIRSFFREVASKTWRAPTYSREDLPRIVDEVDQASLDEVRTALTAINRSERFFGGTWERYLKNGTMTRLVGRVGTLLGRE